MTITATSPARAASVMTSATLSAPVLPYSRVTSWLVGTTTIRLGATRHGPSAPWACQLGKYDTLTSTGVPTRSTWKETELSVCEVDETAVVGSGTTVGLVSVADTRVQSDGPPAAGTTFHAAGSSYQVAAGKSQLVWAGFTPVHTTGRLASGVTSAEFLIS